MKVVRKTVMEISKFCCEQMEQASDAKAVILPSLESSTPLTRAKIFGPRDHRQMGAARSFEVSFCPFCSEKIIFEEQ